MITLESIASKDMRFSKPAFIANSLTTEEDSYRVFGQLLGQPQGRGTP